MALKAPSSTPERSRADTSMRENVSRTGHRPGHKRKKHELRWNPPEAVPNPVTAAFCGEEEAHST